MIVYNVTVSIDQDVCSEWLEWMKQVHIPDVMRTGHFQKYRILRVHGEEDNGVTYAIQYEAPNWTAYNEYMEKCAPGLQKLHRERYEGKFAAFRTILEIVDELRS
jgi:hypothetical protein